MMFSQSDGKDRSLNKGKIEKLRQTLNSFFLTDRLGIDYIDVCCTLIQETRIEIAKENRV